MTRFVAAFFLITVLLFAALTAVFCVLVVQKFFYACIENIGYRHLTVLWRAKAFKDWLAGEQGWGRLKGRSSRRDLSENRLGLELESEPDESDRLTRLLSS